MTLESDHRAEIVAYRLERAKNTIQEVKDVGNIGYYAASLSANPFESIPGYMNSLLVLQNPLVASNGDV